MKSYNSVRSFHNGRKQPIQWLEDLYTKGEISSIIHELRTNRLTYRVITGNVCIYLKNIFL